MTGFISTVASKGTISIDGWIRMGLLSVPLRWPRPGYSIRPCHLLPS